MFDSKSPIVKTVGYGIIGFFVLIIIISFGMPDFMTKIGMDDSIIAMVNGQKVHRYDYLRFRDSRFRHLKNEKMEDLILDYYLGEVLLLQQARKAGLSVSEQRLADLIRNDIPDFKDPETGAFDPERYKRIREINHLNNSSFYDILRKDFIKNDFLSLIKSGLAVQPDYILTDHISSNSIIQIQYCHVSDMDLRKRFSTDLVVSDADIDAEMEKNKKEIKDPKTDRVRIKSRLEGEKLKTLKKQLVETINAQALQKAPFSKTAALLGGAVAVSEPFTIGEDIRERGPQGRPLTAISTSPVFLEECMSLEPGRSSRMIESSAGLYLFTPLSRKVASAAPSPEDAKKLRDKAEGDVYNMVTSNLMLSLREKSKIIKNLKTD
jgi:hypothetical protein